MLENKFEEVTQKLKSCFFGIDEQIDQVVKAFETWLSVKDYQVRPITICLWGLTGTGKTALINKTIEFLELDKKKFYVKFGSKTSGLDSDFDQNDCEDTVFILDEFQYFRTKKEGGDELERDEDNSTNIIWELLDGGIVNLYGQSNMYNYEKMQIISTIHVLKSMESVGAVLKNGIISHPRLAHSLKKLHIPREREDSLKEFKLNNFSGDEYDGIPNFMDYCDAETENKNAVYSDIEIKLRTLMQLNWSTLFDYCKNKDIEYFFYNRNEFYDFLINATSIDTIVNFLQALRDGKPKLEKRDYTKSLIFVIGNLDECFTMSNDLNSDLDADYFYNKTKKITIVDVRKSLLKRFRTEQIARLGSSHIIYPSLSKKAFQEIINKELNVFKNIVLAKFPNNILNVEFSDSIKSLIYKEGVFPIIGARSVFSTVNEIIYEKFTYIINLMLLNKDENNINITFNYNANKNIITLQTFKLTDLIDTCDFKYNIKIDKLRTEKNKGKQTHRAVHEAGHAVCSIILEHSFPEVVYSVVLNAKDSGFNLFNPEDTYYQRRNTYINTAATLFGGYAAEEMIFGEENMSNGCSSDIEAVTTQLLSLYKDCGFKSGLVGKYVSSSFVSGMFETSNYSLTDGYDTIEDVVKKDIINAMSKAKVTLTKQMPLFLNISKYLIENPKITNKKLKELTKKYVVDMTMDEINQDKEQIFTDKFNEKLKKLTDGK